MNVLGFGRAVGIFLMCAGLSLGVVAGWQLWGTGVYTRGEQQRLGVKFEESVQGVEESTGGFVEGADVAAFFSGLSVGDPVARMEIPAIDFEYVVVEGVDSESLRLGPGRFPQGSFFGWGGNVSVAGHRSTYDAPFNRVDELVAGDEIFVSTFQGVFTYLVVGYDIVVPEAVEVLDDKGDDRLTLVGCHPRWGSTYRIVVVAALVGEPLFFDGSGFVDEVHDGASGVNASGSGNVVLDGEFDGWRLVLLWVVLSWFLWALIFAGVNGVHVWRTRRSVS